MPLQQGETFFQGWDFFTSADPTHGLVDYIDEASGRRDGILEINSAGNAVMRVETTPTVPGNRKSIRITTQATFNGGLVIMDAVHMPHGCGTWPAFWSNGPNWPNGGEIDILEGVHDYANNQATLHTSDGCTIASSSSSALAISGSVISGTDCSVSSTANQGCGIRANSATTYGSGFNENGGGVYAMKWDATGIAVYFFPRDSIPADITANTPLPETWGAAQARWPAASCDPFRFFSDHHAIFDTTLCGDWAGGVWNAAGIPGQEESCAQRTGFATCDAFIRARGSAFQEAYWEVRYMQIYEESNMFHSTYLYPTQQYLNLAALAEARAAEAAAKAEEAEYLAYQAALQEERARYSQHPPFRYQQQLASGTGQCSAHSCGCTYAAQPPAFSAYSPSLYDRPVAPSYGRPLFPHQYGSRHGYHPHAHHQVPAVLQSSPLEKELKVKLREETLARHRAEQELRRKEEELAIRQRQLPAPKRTDDAEFIQRMFLASLLGAGAPMKGQTSESTLPMKANEAPKPNPSTRNQNSSPEGSLIDQLKARYTNEGHDEIRDTITAIVNSLSDNKPSKKQDANAAAGSSRSTVDSRSSERSVEFIRATINSLSSKPSAGPTSQTRAAAPPSTKGKEKDTTSPFDFSSIDLKAALERVESIEHTFRHLESEFDLPSQLDFIVAPKGDISSVFPHLAFTARNHPVRYYEQTLTTLLNQLDLIESHGDATLRRRRKDAVGSIEKALDDLEREVTALWKARVAKEQESKKQEQESTSATAPSSSEEESSTVRAPQPIRTPIIDFEAKAEPTTQDAEEEKDSGDLVSVNQDTNNSETTPAAEEKDAEEQEQTEEPVASSPNPTLAELAPEAPDFSNEEEKQEAVQEQRALDASEESPKEDSGTAVVDETSSIDESHPLLEPSVIADSQQEASDDNTSAEDTFLLAALESPEVKPKLAHRQRASVEDDLGSDWSDLDA
ncbi:hypothetical protein EST38_g8441 [Candolleomyces aberdarensis]|uniref:GH16 domain-containing protein n=1 Tax=Candolleomyces aberdarensis TaxID=2316362 RepID=A0A4V1Q356_9AGAR|nr:hypothetical protein EST38_g8441 [Candolleomyces aberdarensis]